MSQAAYVEDNHRWRMKATDRAFESIIRNARSGDPEAQYNLGNFHWHGSAECSVNRPLAIEWYRASARRNCLDAIFALARIFDYDSEFAPNYEEAFAYYKRAADLRSPYAQYCVGHCYALGHGVKKDEAEAANWYLRSALQKPPGFTVAQHALGICFQSGIGVAQDEEEAVNWFRRAADQGLPIAQYDLANAYRLGQGVAQDFVTAAKLYRSAATQGDRGAQYNLGVCLFRGVGTGRDRAEAVVWYQKAAQQGLAVAQFNLGVCYCDGDGTPIDWSHSYAWFRTAADNGDQDARQNAAALARLMTPAEIDRAHQIQETLVSKLQ
jgi:TPR repeat protein